MGARRALGRGLDELLSESRGDRRQVAVDQIAPNPRQPRRSADQAQLQALAASIRQFGVLQPLIVTHDGGRPGRYLLVAGERRWRAARLAGVADVPVTVVSASEQARLEIALVENVQRSDLGPLDRAEAYHALIEEFGMSQREVAARMGLSRPGIANTLRLRELDANSRQAVLDERITEGHARALLAVGPGPGRDDLLQAIVREQLSVRAAERRARTLAEPAHPEGRSPGAGTAEDPELAALARELQRSLGTRVMVHGSHDRGRIVIEYYAGEELDALVARLTPR